MRPSQKKSASISRTRSSPRPLDRIVRALQSRFEHYNRRRLTWTDAVNLCAAFSINVSIERSRHDAVLSRQLGQTRIIVSDRVHLDTWGVFCLAHELGHELMHPGPREFYLGSPGWYGRTEAEANVLGLIALSPHGAAEPYPRILQVKPAGDAITLQLWLARTELDSTRWISRDLTLQRYR